MYGETQTTSNPKAENGEYDNTNQMAVWPARDTQSLVASGRVNVNGWDTQGVIVQNQTKNGKEVMEVYVKVGAIFPNNNKKSEKAPDFSGPLEMPEAGLNQISLWNRGDEKKTISGSFSYFEKTKNDPPF